MTITTVEPERQGFSSERLARIAPYLQQKYVDSGRLPGCQLLISRDGEPVHFHSQGSLRENGEALPDDAMFRIASMTKPVTSTAFMSLFEEGKVGLEWPVSRVLPELKDTGVLVAGGFEAPYQTKAPDRPMQMVDLLRHTAGFTYSFQYRSAIDYAHRKGKIENTHGNHDLDGFIKALGEIPLEFSPGTAWNYSVATDVLGAGVQRVADKPLDEVFAERIFKPLGMDDTGFFAPQEKHDRLTDCWVVGPDGKNTLMDTREKSAWGVKPKLLSGGGGLVSTSEDYHRFCLAYLNGGELDGHRLLSPKTIDLMTSNHLPGGKDLPQVSQSLFSEADNDGIGFGLGFAVTMDPAQSLQPGSPGEFYWGGYFSTAFWIDPIERVIVVFMTQVGPSMNFNVRRELKTLVNAAMTESYF